MTFEIGYALINAALNGRLQILLIFLEDLFVSRDLALSNNKLLVALGLLFFDLFNVGPLAGDLRVKVLTASRDLRVKAIPTLGDLRVQAILSLFSDSVQCLILLSPSRLVFGV